MKHKEMDWKAWLAVIIIVVIIGGIASGMRASAESTTPTDLPVVNDDETYWLDEVEGEVILDDPAYFMDFEEEEPAVSEEAAVHDEEEEISLADVLGNDESSAESAEDNAEQRVGETPAESEQHAEDTPDATEETVPSDEVVSDPVNSPAEGGTDAPSTDNEDATDTPDAPDAPTTDDPVTDPTETPDTPVDEPTTEPPTEPTDTPTEQPAETPEQPEETEQSPVDLKTLFDVSIKVPSGWRNSYSATVRIKITPAGDQMWHKVRYRIGDEEWETIPDKDFVLYDGYYYTDIEVYYNAKMSVRLFGDEETYFDTNKEINIFDHYAPEVTAGFRDMVLHVEAVDDLSEVAGIQVNSLLFTTLVDGVLDVRMEEPLLGYKQLAIRAYDYAGNFSDPVTLDNPYYVGGTYPRTHQYAQTYEETHDNQETYYHEETLRQFLFQHHVSGNGHAGCYRDARACYDHYSPAADRVCDA